VGWAEVKVIEGSRLQLSFQDLELEIQEPSAWWEPYLLRMDECLKKGRILAHIRSDGVDTLVLVDGVGRRTTLHKPWKLW